MTQFWTIKKVNKDCNSAQFREIQQKKEFKNFKIYYLNPLKYN